MNAQLTAMVEQARVVRACWPGLIDAEKFESVEALMASEYGPKFAAWFAIRVQRTPMPEFEDAIRRDPATWTTYSAWLKALNKSKCCAGCACHMRPA